VENHEIWD